MDCNKDKLHSWSKRGNPRTGTADS